ncbi:hypothetical protein BCR44DRAFT_35134 [Catenaria anguillulae PL171]|uniref:Uncharacterized protein n=1 Tax=Catenaria anguillulae PL171 TaxID=765915 RepID=A0A1Y2H787_9FUNG|nr:hypothetical protein BCR44DRAFT_35134 [Catenaria anguillulae PL171]
MSRTQKTADYGALRTGITSTIAKCNAPDSFVTRLDIQTNQAPGWDSPYVSGFRVYCNDNSPPQPINWNKPTNATTYVSLDGKVAKDGIKDLIVSHKSYVNMVGYGTETMLGTFKDVNLWQQAAQKEYKGCLLAGIECTFVSWFDGCRAHFSCPTAGDSGSATAGAVDPVTCSGGGFSIGAFAGGIGAGLVVAAALVGLLVFVRSRKSGGQKQVGNVESSINQQQQQVPVMAADPYAAVFNNGGSASSPQAQQYGDVHVLSPYGNNDNFGHQQQHQQADPNKIQDWQQLPKP